MWNVLRNTFLTWFGKLKYFHYPFFIVWDPGSYQLKGNDVRELIGLLQPGDILLRSYNNYVDGLFIPGQFSHVGLYVGHIVEAQRIQAGSLLQDAVKREGAQKFFKTGQQMVIHAMAEGVQMEDILTFSRCDYLVVLRLPEQLKIRHTGKEVAAGKLLRMPGFQVNKLKRSERGIHESLHKGENVDRAEVISPACEMALGLLGSEYDFGFDFTNFDTFSCSEFVYYCYRSVDHYLHLRPVPHRFMYFFKGTGIAPDDYLSTGLQGIWASRSAINNVKILPLLKDHPDILAHHSTRTISG